MLNWLCLKIRSPPYLKGRICTKGLDTALILWYCFTNHKPKSLICKNSLKI